MQRTGVGVVERTSEATQRSGHGRDGGGAFPGRIVALDLARFVAIAGMMTAHLLLDAAPPAVLLVVTGFPSTLFAVLGGVSAVLSTRRYRVEGRPLAATVSVASRGLAVAVLGFILGFAPTWVIGVLLYYGVAMILASLFLRLPLALITAVTVVLAVGGPHIIHWLVSGPGVMPGELSYAGPFEFARSVFFTGEYPVITWLAYMLVGICVGRVVAEATDRRRAIVSLAVTGAALFAAGTLSDLVSRPAVIAAVSGGSPTESDAAYVTLGRSGSPIGPGWLAVVNGAPHSGSTADILRTGGAAVLVIALLLLLTARLRSPEPLLLRPITRAGAAPLTIYSLHILVTAILFLPFILSGQYNDVSAAPWWMLGPSALALQLGGALLIGTLLAMLHRRGPLEALVSGVARLGARAAGDR